MKSPPTQAAPAEPQDGSALKLPVGLAELAEFDDSAEAKRLALLERDAELLHKLMLGGYTGRDWDAFADVLARYAYPVILSWIHKGTLVQRCFAKGVHAPRLFRHKRSDREDIARSIVAEAIYSFRNHVLIPGRWNAGKGATLKTYFIGRCLLQYPNAYREWRSQNVCPRIDPEELARQLALRTNLPATTDLLAELHRRLPEVVKEEQSPAFLAALFAAGFSQKKIAAAAGLTTMAVQSKIKRLRKAAA
jgi:hypothetical protein